MKTLDMIKQAIRDKYAWPGGYPMYLVMNDGGALCMDCAREEYRQIAHDTVKEWKTGWDCAGADVNWEDTTLICDHCNERIGAACGEEEEG